MDANGTRFHLYKEAQDWRRCRLAGQPAAVTDWLTFSRQENAPDWLHLAWSAESGLTLAAQLARFPRSRRDQPLVPESRRGAAADQFGNWYWISHDRQRLFWIPAGTGRPARFWAQAPVTPAKPPSAFAPTTPTVVEPITLGGLTVTSHHYLVVGNVTDQGLLIFDLHRGGEPMQVALPAGTAFAPFDMAAADDGGFWVLDRTNRAYWAFDRTFQLRGHGPYVDTPAAEHVFQPVAEKAATTPVGPTLPTGGSPPGAVAGVDLGLLTDPIAIEAGPAQSIFILDRQPGPAPSVLYQYKGATAVLRLALADEIDVVTLDGVTTQEQLQVVAHDMAYVAEEERLYVVERDGNQTLAFQLFLADAPAGLRLLTSYLPLQNFGSRALVRVGAALYYDLTGRDTTNDAAVRWVQLQPFDEARYQQTGTLETPVLDGRTPDCVWHRLFLDGCLPAETSVEVWTRATNEPDLLSTMPFTREPELYLRSGSAEIANYSPFTAQEQGKEGVGTWEVLCQQLQGRYAQLRLVLQGNGRVTPQIRALRLYYPRFSYAKEYLPAVYLEEATAANFTERLLANMEGFYTEIEGQIRAVYSLFDARSAPADALDWLAGWLGLVVDPIWAAIQERRPVAIGVSNGSSGQRPVDRRRLLIRFARRLYERRGTADGIKFALQLLLEPCLEALLARMQRAAVQPDLGLAAEFARYDLTLPTPTTSAEGFEDLLYAYLLAPLRPSTVRIVERYQTRNGRAVAAGDPTRNGSAERVPITPALIRSDAHRFAVLIPDDLTPEEEAMVRRIVALEKPAHTLFEVRRYWDYYRIGEARMGLDTILGESSRFTPMLLGRDYLAEGFLAAAHPFNAKERFVVA